MVLDALKQHLAPAPTRSAYPAGGECAVCWLVEGCHWVGKVAPMNRRTQTHRRFPKWLMVDGQMGMSTEMSQKVGKTKVASANLESEPILVEHHPLTKPHPHKEKSLSRCWFQIFNYLLPYGGNDSNLTDKFFQWVDGWLRPPSWSSIHLPIYPPSRSRRRFTTSDAAG